MAIVSIALVLAGHAGAQNDSWYVKVCEHPAGAGTCVNLNVTPDGNDGIPANEFRQYKLQDKITYVSYRLPDSAAVALFTGRFWKNADGDIANFFNDHNPIKDFIKGTTGIRIGEFGKSPLVLRGTGRDEVIDLAQFDGGKYNDKIRSAKIYKID